MSYDLNVYYDGGKYAYAGREDLDHWIDAAVGKASWASGFDGHERDLAYEFGTEAEASEAQRKVGETLRAKSIEHRLEVVSRAAA